MAYLFSSRKTRDDSGGHTREHRIMRLNSGTEVQGKVGLLWANVCVHRRKPSII